MEKTGENKQKATLSPLLRRLLRLKVWVVEHLRLSERQVTLIWAALIGALGALASESFRKASDLVHYLATGSESGIITSFVKLAWWQRLAVPTAGGLLAGLTLWLGNRLFASVRQKTTTDYMEAIVVGSGWWEGFGDFQSRNGAIWWHAERRPASPARTTRPSQPRFLSPKSFWAP